MPDLDTSKLMNVISELPDRELQTPSQGKISAPFKLKEIRNISDLCICTF